LVNVPAVRFLPAVPAFEDCVATLRLPSPRTPSRSHAQVAALPEPQRDVSVAVTEPRPLPAAAGARQSPPPASVAAPPVQEDPYIRSDAPPQSIAKAQTGAEIEPKQDKQPRKDPGAGLNLVSELGLRYAQNQDRLSDAARVELAAFAREYLAGRRSDLVLIAGSAADGAQTRRRALEIKGFLVRNGLPAARVLIHVQGEKLPQRDGQPVEPPGEASRMAVWQVR
jgi:outer membrane protein OmpA-like peptidoglycan-associated protein